MSLTAISTKKTSESVPEADTSQAELAARQIERAIIDGEFRPRERLGMHKLSSRYALGVTPIREGLSRLAHRGFVVAVDNRGFRVADATEADLRDIIRLRMYVEVNALRLSIINGDDVWEANILAILHRLERSANRGSNPDANGVSDDLHKSFHMTLLAACNSPRMLDLSSLLFDQAYRYRRLLFGETKVSARDFLAEHKVMADLVVHRELAPALELYANHINRTLASLYPNSKPISRVESWVPPS